MKLLKAYMDQMASHRIRSTFGRGSEIYEGLILLLPVQLYGDVPL